MNPFFTHNFVGIWILGFEIFQGCHLSQLELSNNHLPSIEMQRLSPSTESSAQDKRKVVDDYNYLGKELPITEPAQASAYFSQALHSGADAQNFQFIIDSHCLSGQALLELGQIQDALLQFITALSLAETHGLSKPELLHTIYKAYKSLGDFENALKYHERYHEALQNINTPHDELSDDIKSFLRHIAHDIKEPVRIISSYQTLLSRSLHNDGIDKYDDYLNYIKKAIERITKLATTFSYYVKIDTDEKRRLPIQLDEIVWMVENTLKKGYNKNIQILCDELPTVNVDFEQISCLIQHLIDNAIRYNDNETSVITIKNSDMEGYHRIAIKDNGTGIAFKPTNELFSIALGPKRHNKNPNSCGMGLIICKKIIEKHKGDIWIKSTPDEGTTVYFTLPIS